MADKKKPTEAAEVSSESARERSERPIEAAPADIEDVGAVDARAAGIDLPLRAPAGIERVEGARAEGYARQAAGREYDAAVDEDLAEQRARERAAYADDRDARYADAQLLVADPEAAIRARPAETVEPIAAPGLSERGWSHEVTARHPALLADALEEIAAEGGSGRRGSLAPAGGDLLSLEAAQDVVREHGFSEVRKDMAIQEAIKRNSDALAAADGARERANPYRQIAVGRAAEQAREVSEGLNSGQASETERR